MRILSTVLLGLAICCLPVVPREVEEGEEESRVPGPLESPTNFGVVGDLVDKIPGVNKIPIVDQLLNNTGFTWKIFREGNRLVEILNFSTPIGVLKGEYCYAYGDTFIISELMKLNPLAKDVSPEDMEDLLVLCDKLMTQNMFAGMTIIPSIFLEIPGGVFRRTFIFPGTRWCGAGNISRHYEHLGPAKETDKCCRTHDHCPDNLEKGESKHGLRNSGLYTKSNCDCDKKFYDCLRGDNSLISNSVGTLYFNILSTDCFTLEHPLKCVKKFPPMIGKCVQYERDRNKSKEWQFVTPKSYDAGEHSKDIDKMFREA